MLKDRYPHLVLLEPQGVRVDGGGGQLGDEGLRLPQPGLQLLVGLPEAGHQDLGLLQRREALAVFLADRLVALAQGVRLGLRWGRAPVEGSKVSLRPHLRCHSCLCSSLSHPSIHQSNNQRLIQIYFKYITKKLYLLTVHPSVLNAPLFIFHPLFLSQSPLPPLTHSPLPGVEVGEGQPEAQLT